MADDKRDAPRPFDVTTVEHLVRLMSQHDLSEIALQDGDQTIRLRKGGKVVAVAAAPAAAAPVAHAAAAPPPAAPAAAPAGKKLLEVKSELIGTFYTRPAPDKPEFVKVGSRVTPDTTVCIVMAMKVNNEIKAGVSGTIAEVVAKNEDFVDFNSVLFRVDPA